MMQRKVLKMQQLWKPENIETEVYIAFCFLSSLSFGSLSFLKEMLQALAVCILICLSIISFNSFQTLVVYAS